MNKIAIIENRIGAAVFGLLGISGIVGICAGNMVHVVTFAISAVMCCALWAESIKLEKEIKKEQGND